MTQDNGASLRDRATHERNPQAVSAVPVGIPSAHDPANDPAYRIGLVRNGVERAFATLLQHRTTARDPKAGGFEFAEIPAWVLRQWHEHLTVAAQAIEARRAATGTGAVHESAVANGDAPALPATGDET